jgi:site-specific DNA-methyltransferase (adenine-specific)
MGWLVWDKGQREFSLADGELAWTSADRALRIFTYSRGRQLARESRVHPTQKPVELMLWCLGLFPKAEAVVDPFMGSGTTLVAAKRLGRKAIGIERERKYCELAVERLRQSALPLEMGA